jgi:hypothetical protein
LNAYVFESSIGLSVITILGTTASIAATTISPKIDAAVATVKLTGKTVGASADATQPGNTE